MRSREAVGHLDEVKCGTQEESEGIEDLVELTGIEPVASSLRTRRSPS